MIDVQILASGIRTTTLLFIEWIETIRNTKTLCLQLNTVTECDEKPNEQITRYYRVDPMLSSVTSVAIGSDAKSCRCYRPIGLMVGTTLNAHYVRFVRFCPFRIRMACAIRIDLSHESLCPERRRMRRSWRRKSVFRSFGHYYQLLSVETQLRTIDYPYHHKNERKKWSERLSNKKELSCVTVAVLSKLVEIVDDCHNLKA